MHGNESINVYCDESTHLLRNLSSESFLVLGAVTCPRTMVWATSEAFRDLKEEHGISRNGEVKWTKIAGGNARFYRALVDRFFEDDDLAARILLAPKNELHHSVFSQDHDDFYFKMYYQTLLPIVQECRDAEIYLDVKDTRSSVKNRKLQDILATKLADGRFQRVKNIQAVRSHEVELLQVADVLAGALNYRARGLNGSAAKLSIVDRIQERSRRPIDRTTPLSERKLNLFYWKPQKVQPL